MEEAEDEPLFCERAAGIDIGKQMVSVTIRVPSDTRRGGRQQETREFGTTRRQLLEMADWLRCWGVERAGMEATSDYWKPVYFLLEQQGLDLLLYQASQVKALPGRPKTDKLDSVWLAKVTERGSLAGSFVPPDDIRRLRAHTRYRRKLTQARTAEKQRAEKLLEDAHLKLSSVISDIHGVSGRAMLEAVIAGERNPRALAALARGVMRRKLALLEEALDCSFFTPEHAFVLRMMLDNIDHYTAQIAVLDERIAILCQPYQRQIDQLDAIPGFGVTTAQDLIAEIGVDMSVFPTAGHLCSWARVAPRAKESGGKRKGQSATGRGNPYIGAALGEASSSAGRTQTFLGAKLRRLCRHMPRKKAQGAVMRTQLAIAHALLSDPAAEYHELGPGYYDQQAGTRRQARGHVRSLERLGYEVTLKPLAGTDPETGEIIARAAG
ncbi:IS110 family transposase [Trebonia kvetii]|uniref:IS110 family transposase n=1 Tax=Trebonia kvetii TaxID=2480626 RepID=A0A6P2BU14_9ACTN|nr:IS110 family transposase [Trebonia kvetii]TVZ01716.1 IS110 family transposase [Trebonia kvetii]